MEISKYFVATQKDYAFGYRCTEKNQPSNNRQALQTNKTKDRNID